MLQVLQQFVQDIPPEISLNNTVALSRDEGDKPCGAFSLFEDARASMEEES